MNCVAGASWFQQVFTPSHLQSQCDPRLWSQVEGLVRQTLVRLTIQPQPAALAAAPRLKGARLRRRPQDHFLTGRCNFRSGMRVQPGSSIKIAAALPGKSAAVWWRELR